MVERGKHVPPDDRSFLNSVVRHVAGAVALVVVVAAGFWGVGQVRTTTPDPVVGPGPSPTAAPASPSPGDTEPPDDGGDPGEDPGDDGGEDPGDDGGDDAGEDDGGDTEQPPASDAIPPANVSVQILDAVLEDAGAGMNSVADRLREDGYRVVATNRAIRVYEVTTVFYTAGHEAAARQIAQQYGFQRVEPKPDNLSDTVHVHLVVGQDHAG